MSDKTCDHISVGMIVEKGGKILLIERKKFPFGMAPPAGHVDGDESYEIAARRELKEEVGLGVTRLELLWEGKKENSCRRKDGTWHYWKVYGAEVEGDIETSDEEVKRFGWYDSEQIEKLLERTNRYRKGEISDEEWEERPGVELVWAELIGEIIK